MVVSLRLCEAVSFLIGWGRPIQWSQRDLPIRSPGQDQVRFTSLVAALGTVSNGTVKSQRDEPNNRPESIVVDRFGSPRCGCRLVEVHPSPGLLALGSVRAVPVGTLHVPRCTTKRDDPYHPTPLRLRSAPTQVGSPESKNHSLCVTLIDR